MNTKIICILAVIRTRRELSKVHHRIQLFDRGICGMLAHSDRDEALFGIWQYFDHGIHVVGSRDMIRSVFKRYRRGISSVTRSFYKDQCMRSLDHLKYFEAIYDRNIDEIRVLIRYAKRNDQMKRIQKTVQKGRHNVSDERISEAVLTLRKSRISADSPIVQEYLKRYKVSEEVREVIKDMLKLRRRSSGG